MLKIISCNLNGIRSANKKGFFDWLHKQKADIVCLQELRASSQQINEEKINFRNDIFYIKSAEKKGYSGVGIITKHKPKKVIYSYGDTEFDNEGRYIQLNFENFIVVSLYAPSGSSSEERQKAKFRFMKSFMVKNTRKSDLIMFSELAGLEKFDKVSDIPFRIALPAFMTSELKTAFQIGFLLFLPFLVIDMVISSILMSLGMMMLSPMLVALPFKLLLFVLVDGWSMTVGSLVSTFAAG